MKYVRPCLLSAGAILALAVAVAGAQTAPTAPATPTALGALRAQAAPPPIPTNPPQEKVMDGPVKHVDPLAKTISVGWLLGLASTTLEVTDETRIVVEGTTASLQDIREGDVVEAAYEPHNGKNVATLIKVTEAEPRRGAGAPPRAPATSGAPSMASPPGADAPAPGAPKTP